MRKKITALFKTINHYHQLASTYQHAVAVAPDHALAHMNWGLQLAKMGHLGEALLKLEKATEISPERAAPYLSWGITLARSQSLPQAIEKFKLAISKDEKNPMPYLLWGTALLEQGQLEAAQKKYEQAIALAPKDPTLFAQWGLALARIGESHQSIKFIKQSLTLYPEQPQLYFLWGAILAESADYGGAIEKFKMTLRFMPKHAEAYYFWSTALNHLGRYEEALEKSKQALLLDLHKADVYLNQGDILVNLNRLDLAVTNYQEALRLQPDNIQAYLSCGVALCLQAKHEAGYVQFEQALSLCSSDLKSVSETSMIDEIHYQWGLFLLREGRAEEALPHLKRAAGDMPPTLDPECLLNFAVALLKVGQADEAVTCLTRLIERHKWHPQAHFLLGSHYMGLNEHQKAQAHFEYALEEAPDFDEAAINLALVLCDQGQTVEAIRQIRPVFRRNPETAKIHFFYGLILYQQGAFKDALAKYQSALSLQPTYPEAQLGLAETYVKLSQPEAAEHLLTELAATHPDNIPVQTAIQNVRTLLKERF